MKKAESGSLFFQREMKSRKIVIYATKNAATVVALKLSCDTAHPIPINVQQYPLFHNMYFILNQFLYLHHWQLSLVLTTLQNENICWNLNFAILLMVNPLNSNSGFYWIFTNLSMTDYITKIQKSKFANLCIWPSLARSVNKFCVYFQPVM